MVYIFHDEDHFYNVCRKLIIKDANFNYDKVDKSYINELKQIIKEAYGLSLKDVNCTIVNKFNLRRFLDVITYELLKIRKRKELYDTIDCLSHDLELYKKIFKKKEVITKEDMEEYREDKFCIVNCFKDVVNYEAITEDSKQQIKEDLLGTEEFINMLDIIGERNSGIYIFYDTNKTPIYVGKSISDLVQRICSSMDEKKRTEYIEYVSYALTKTKTDTNIYEMYYIAKLKPFFNYDGKNSDETTLTLPELNFSDIVQIYKKQRNKGINNLIISRINATN